jgi:hypothetical protein
MIDEQGRQSHRYEDGIDLTSSRPSDRLANLLWRPNQRCNAAYGMIRSDVLRRTSLIGAYPSSDQNLLAELALLGHLRQIPAPLFFRRDHPQASLRAATSSRDVALFFDSDYRARLHLPLARRMFEYFRMAVRIPLSLGQRLKVLRILAVMTYRHKRPLAREIFEAAGEALAKPASPRAQFAGPLMIPTQLSTMQPVCDGSRVQDGDLLPQSDDRRLPD